MDGVLTDGKIWIFPAPAGAQQTAQRHAAEQGGQGGFGLVSQSMIEAKGFHAHDGTAISLARLAGIKTGLITKRISETVALRARDLKLEAPSVLLTTVFAFSYTFLGNRTVVLW